MKNKMVLTYAQSINNVEFDKANFSIISTIHSLYKNGEVKKFLFWAPSRQQNGSHDSNIPDRLTATVWKDEKSMKDFINSPVHKYVVSLKKQDVLKDSKTKVISIEPEEINNPSFLKEELSTHFANVFSNENLTYESFNVIEESNITGLLGLL